jgi:hypothetical protein
VADLDTAIRARLDDWLDDICGAWRNGCPVAGHAEPIKMRAALTAVLDLHKPRPAGIPGKPHLADCSTCRDLGPEINSPAGYPCDEIEAIAKALGVEAS